MPRQGSACREDFHCSVALDPSSVVQCQGVDVHAVEPCGASTKVIPHCLRMLVESLVVVPAAELVQAPRLVGRWQFSSMEPELADLSPAGER